MPHHRMGETFGDIVNNVNTTLTRSLPEALVLSNDTGRLSLRIKIRSLYGEDIFKKTRQLESMRIKHSKNIARLAFLKRCRDHNIIPNCVKLKFHKKRRNINTILKRAEMSILRSELADTRHELFKLNTEIANITEQLMANLDPADWTIFDNLSKAKSARVLKLNTDTHVKKFNKLQEESRPNINSQQLDADKVIINLTEETLDKPTESLLLKGLNYAVVPSRIPAEEIICSVETAIKDLPSEEAEEIRQDVAVVLRKAKPPKCNLTRDEKAALKVLKEDITKIVLPADKGNATVIMETEQYKNKMKAMIEAGPYKSVRNPTKRIALAVTKLIKSNNFLDINVKKQLVNSDPRPPLLYGLPKVHKVDIPMRPIVSSIGSPTYNLAKFVSRQLGEFVGKTESFVKDSRHFISLIKDLQLQNTDMLVSFDVESLFTKVPIPETVSIIKELLNNDLAELAELCLQSTYFYFDGRYYEQTEGAAMGSPLSPIAANLYMERFEVEALQSAILKPKAWLRYVDDVWAVWPHGRETLEDFLGHINSIHPNIKFTMEIECNKSLPFLDVLTSRKQNGRIGHSVYRKPTHTNRYLNADSHHHPAQKNAVLNTLINRAIHLSDSDGWEREKRHLKLTLGQNGYSMREIQNAFTKQLNKKNRSPGVENQVGLRDNVKMAYIPYIKGTTEKIGRILNKSNIKTVYKPVQKIKSLLRPVKDKIPLSMPGVYEIPCSCGSVYIGETKRLISTRLKEHIRHTKNEDIDKSAVAEHSKNSRHGILFDKTKVLANIPYYYPRIVRESIEIYKNSYNFNKDDSLRLPRAWEPILHRLKQDGRQ